MTNALTTDEAKNQVNEHFFEYKKSLDNCKTVKEMQVPTMDVLN
jgi:hypothetical protein